jgi:predicted RNA-binding protein
MCDLRAYVKSDGQEVLLLEAVNQVNSARGTVTVRNLFGEEKTVPGEVREISLTKNRLVIEGVSLISNFRTQIQEIVSSRGVEKLIDELRSKGPGELEPKGKSGS